jgi:ubiquinone/menaquinone biosynthesis C-methylase UbiE/DNA-binding transcriptional ArsR family regulator
VSVSKVSDLLQLFGEPTRLRLLALLEATELTVAEITAITEMVQSRVSTHLGRLREAGVLRDRKAGAATYYAFSTDALEADAQKLWQIVRGSLDDAVFSSDRQRREALIRARASWPEAFAGEMERHYSPGRTWEAYARGLLGLLELGDVLDVGSGDGAVAKMLAPRSKSLTCIDRSEKVIDAAKDRLRDFGNLRFAIGDAHELPFPDESFDQVLLFNVLSYADKPARAIGEAGRVLRPNGKLVIVTLGEHDHDVAAYQHVNNGFTDAAITKMIKNAALEVEHCGTVMREKRAPHFQVTSASARKAKKR